MPTLQNPKENRQPPYHGGRRSKRKRFPFAALLVIIGCALGVFFAGRFFLSPLGGIAATILSILLAVLFLGAVLYLAGTDSRPKADSYGREEERRAARRTVTSSERSSRPLSASGRPAPRPRIDIPLEDDSPSPPPPPPSMSNTSGTAFYQPPKSSQLTPADVAASSPLPASDSVPTPNPIPADASLSSLKEPASDTPLRWRKYPDPPTLKRSARSVTAPSPAASTEPSTAAPEPLEMPEPPVSQEPSISQEPPVFQEPLEADAIKPETWEEPEKLEKLEETKELAQAEEDVRPETILAILSKAILENSLEDDGECDEEDEEDDEDDWPPSLTPPIYDVEFSEMPEDEEDDFWGDIFEHEPSLEEAVDSQSVQDSQDAQTLEGADYPVSFSEQEPVKQEPVEQEPVEQEPIEQKPVVSVVSPAPACDEEIPSFQEAAKEKTGDTPAKTAAANSMDDTAYKPRSEAAYIHPPVDLLRENTLACPEDVASELSENAARLETTLRSFGVDAVSGQVVRGPAVTLYEFTLKQGVKLSKITNLADDIALSLGAGGVRIAPIPDKSSVVGVEVPNKIVTPVLIRDVVDSPAFLDHASPVAFAVGRDIGNQNIIGDISRLPHVLIAGTTGSGKSVCTNSLIISILYKSGPEDVRFIMIDPKMVELAPYNGIPHLLVPVVTDPKKAAGALQWAVFEMMKRYKTFSERGVKKLEEYNAAMAQQSDPPPRMPSVVVVIDELADLMLVAAKEVEESICRIAQMGRAAGIHLVIATQRPSADVITGLMKANIPSRIAFAVASSMESRIILDNGGAEKLVGRGDMLFAPLGVNKPIRVQGCFITPEEIERVVAFVKANGEAQYSDEVLDTMEEASREKEKKNRGESPAPASDEEDLILAATEIFLDTGQASVSMLQRKLKLGYSKAARIVDEMEERGYVGPFEGSKPRQLLITRERFNILLEQATNAPDL